MPLERTPDFIRLDVRKEMTATDILFVKDDSGVYRLQLQVMDNNMPVDLTGRTVALRFKRPKDGAVIEDTEVDILEPASDGKVEYLMKSNIYAYAGDLVGELSVYEGTRRLTAAQFKAKVRNDIDDADAITADDRYPVLTQLIADTSAAVQSAEAAAQSAESAAQAAEAAIDGLSGQVAVHKTAAVLDHPDGSVTAEKIAAGSVGFAQLDPEVITYITNSAEDLDGITAPGIYRGHFDGEGICSDYILLVSRFKSTINLPDGQALEIYTYRQVLTSVSTGTGIRVRYKDGSAAWTAWQNVASTDDITGIIDSLSGAPGGIATLNDSCVVPYSQLPPLVTGINGKTGDVTLDKADVGLANVTNDAQVKRSEMGAAGGVATLDSNGKLVQKPSAADIGAIPISEKAAGGGVATLDGNGFLSYEQVFRKETVLSSVGRFLNVSGLDLNTHKKYKAVFSIPLNIDTNLRLYVNGDTTLTNYYGYSSFVGTYSDNNMICNTIASANNGYVEGFINVWLDHNGRCVMNTTLYVGSDTQLLTSVIVSHHFYKLNSSNITSIGIYSYGTDAFKAGAFLRVWRE